MIDKRTLELVLDWIAAVATLSFGSLSWAGVLSWGATSWSIGVFTGWLARHLLD